ncbi:MAG: L-aspartate oxidase [Bdellovibrionales bacterium]|nr:L-aspartate oxidase [Bdellovibrionales bacterium]
MSHYFDHLIIGSGLAGLAYALKIAEKNSGARIGILAKRNLNTGNTELAQGGIAAVISESDSLQQHTLDTLTAGAGLCRADVVEEMVCQGAERIQDLVNWGVKFDTNSESHSFSLTREGGHSARRILHVEDHTGADIHSHLLQKARTFKNIYFLEEHFAIDLILTQDAFPYTLGKNVCIGAYVLNKVTQEIFAIKAQKVVLATGGAGKIYQYTSNWSGATGDGIAMAFRAGARVANMEFMQFHPTCLYHPQSRNFLISEALRGEGAELINSKGEAFMKPYHPLGSLAPRDIVARSIDAEIKKSGADCVFLDITHKSETFLKSRFPAIYNRCLSLGINISESPIPVVPAAHYLCGGILCDSAGVTDIPNLLVLGESACTGLHGANRLASNSLLECLVLAHNAANSALIETDTSIRALEISPFPSQEHQISDELIVVSHMWEEVRRLMWNYMGIVRSNRRLERAKTRLKYIEQEIQEYYSKSQIHSDILELRNIALVAMLSVRCAQMRKESRGIHYNIDFPLSKSPLGPGVDSIVSSTSYYKR